MVRFKKECWDNNSEYGWEIIDDKGNLVFDAIFNNVQATAIVRWLNENYAPKKRFELKVNVSIDGYPVYMVWDNLKMSHVKFTPRLPKGEKSLQEYVDFLNEIYESDGE